MAVGKPKRKPRHRKTRLPKVFEEFCELERTLLELLKFLELMKASEISKELFKKFLENFKSSRRTEAEEYDAGPREADDPRGK